MKFRPFILAALLHGTTIGLAFTIMPAAASSVRLGDIGTVAVEHQAESLEPAQLPTREITPTERPEITTAEMTPSFVTERAPEEPITPEIVPDPVDQRPTLDEPLPSRPQPKLELPRRAKEVKVSPAERAATPVESAPRSGTSGDFIPGNLLDWTPPDSLLFKFRGAIIVIIEIDAAGMARSVSLRQGTGDEDIDQDVRLALLMGRYFPARVGDRVIATTITKTFTISDPKKAANSSSGSRG